MARMANRAARDLRGAANAARRTATDLNVAARNANNAGHGFRNLGNQATYAEQRLHRLARRLRTIRSIRYGATGMLAGLGTTVTAHRVGSTLIGYEKAMNMVAANMVSHMDGGTPILKGIKGRTSQEIAASSLKMMAALRAKTKQVAQESIFDPSEVAEGLLELARAGATADEALTMLHPTVRLAAAGNLGVAQAVDIATNITKAFGFEVGKTVDVVDVLAMAASNANTTVAQMGQAMKYAAPSAKVAGRSMEETTGVLMSLAKRGLKDSIGGTSIARMLESIYKRSGPAVKALKSIGLAHKDFMNADGTTVAIADMLQMFKDAAKIHGNEKAIMAIQSMMGSRGGRAAKLLFDTAVAEIRANERLLQMAKGRAALMEKLMMSGVYGAYERMRASIVESVISLGEGGLTKDLEYLADKIREMANAFSALDPETKQFIGRLLIAATAITAIGLPLGIFLFSLSSIAAVLGALISPLGLVAAGIGLLAYSLSDSLNVGSTVTKLKEFYGYLGRVKNNLASGWETSEMNSFFEWLGNKLSAINIDLSGLFNSLANSTDPFVSALREIINLAGQVGAALSKIPSFLLNPMSAIQDSGKWIGNKTRSIANGIGSAFAVNKDQYDVRNGSLAQSQADKEVALRVKTDTNVKVDAPSSIALKIPQLGATVGQIPFVTSSDKGKTQVDSAAAVTP